MVHRADLCPLVGAHDLIWLYLAGWSTLISGHFSPVETAMLLYVYVLAPREPASLPMDKG